MAELISNLSYTIENPIEDESFNTLLNNIWQVLSFNQESYHEPGVSERNLVVFI